MRHKNDNTSNWEFKLYICRINITMYLYGNYYKLALKFNRYVVNIKSNDFKLKTE